MIRRYVIAPEQMPTSKPGGFNHFPKKHIVLLAGEAPGIKSALLAALMADNFQVRQVTWGRTAQKTGINSFSISASPEESVESLRLMICPSGEKVGAIINLAGFESSVNPCLNYRNRVAGFFLLLKAFEKDIKESSGHGGGIIANITPLGGQFGSNSPGRYFSEEASGTLGLAKSTAREWPWALTRCIDIDPAIEEKMAAAMVWEELMTDETSLETGIDRQGRWRLALMEKPHISKGLKINSESVILMLGGASGITAAVARELACRHQPRLVILGRTSLSEKESWETANIPDLEGLRSFFIQSSGKKNYPRTPAEIDRRINGILKRRSINNNLKAIRAAGSFAEYRSGDVRDPSVLSSLIKETYEHWGRIDGVVHGAGIIDDRRIRDKSYESFKAVYDTKVMPAMVLTSDLDPSKLKFMVFFSSIAARFGNAGQCDYAAANEVLNKLAGYLAKKWTKTRVISIGWGPWELGMVNNQLKRIYEKKGIGLISENTGIDFFFNELGLETDDLSEVIVASDAGQITGKRY